jgi:hypothetical protein
MYILYICIDVYLVPFQIENGRRKPRQFSFTCFPFAHRASGILSFVCLLTRKQKEVIRLPIFNCTVSDRKY